MAEIGRPTEYTQDKADAICELIGMGYSMRKVCERADMPAMSTVFKWLREQGNFSKQYARATEERTESQHEELLGYGDDALEAVKTAGDPKLGSAMVSAIKMKSENLRWSMAKMKPKKYGDKYDVTSDGKQLPTPILQLPKSD